jgi:acetoin utilization deacetylase AcuC-like enzyme
MGFCLFNNVAVGAAHALARGLKRVAIIDWDVHHGNGTQNSFWRDPRVLYVSSHQFPFYPGSGGLREMGEGPGLGFTVNLPMPAGMNDEDYASVYGEVVLPVCRSYDPELLLVSVGFDPHRDDPLAGMRVTHAGFGALARLCLASAAGSARGRAVFVLEGGYDLDGIARSAPAVMAELLREVPGPAPSAPATDASGRVKPLIAEYRKAHAPYWPTLA